MQVDNAFPGVHLTTGGSGGGGEGGEEGQVPEEVPTRWTDQTALNIADGGRGGAAFVATLAAGVSAAFSFFSQVAVAAPEPERHTDTPLSRSRARSSSASFHVGYARAQNKTPGRIF